MERVLEPAATGSCGACLPLRHIVPAPAAVRGLGLAAGAMIWMALVELLPEALEQAPKPAIAGAVLVAMGLMLAFQQMLKV